MIDRKTVSGNQTYRHLSGTPNIVVMGYAGHGKDTVSELLAELMGVTFVSSSLFAAEVAVIPALAEHGITYDTVQQAYEDRNNYRAEWHAAIAAYNTPNKARLGMELFGQYSIYCGLRSVEEFHALNTVGFIDVTIWVDAYNRLGTTESSSSCSVHSGLANYIIDNNGNKEDLERNVRRTLRQIMDNSRLGNVDADYQDYQDFEYMNMVRGLAKSGEDILAEMTPEKAALLHSAIGLAAEASEAADVLKKHCIYGQELNMPHLIEELGDVRFWMQDICTKLAIHTNALREANAYKLVNSADARYPEKAYSNELAAARRDKEAAPDAE